MIARGLGVLLFLLITTGAASAQRTCRVVICEQVRAGEVCSVRPCSAPQNLVCYGGRYTVGDGQWSYRGGSQGQCEQRCANNPNCSLMEYYYGPEGVRCNLYSRFPQIRWNPSQDAVVCAWE